MFKRIQLITITLIILRPILSDCSMSMKQFDASLDMMRSVCAPKHKVSVEMLNGLRQGIFAEDSELKCYTKCIAQMAGTLTKRGEVSYQKVSAQIGTLLPLELQGAAKQALEVCKDVQNNYKESCDKTFYSVKCTYEFDPKRFKFP